MPARQPSRPVPAPSSAFVPWLALAGALALALFLGLLTSDTVTRRNRVRFQAEFRGLVGGIRSRSVAHETLLRGLAGLTELQPELTSGDFRVWLRRQQLHASFPGLRSVGWSPRRGPDSHASTFVLRYEEGEAATIPDPGGTLGSLPGIAAAMERAAMLGEVTVSAPLAAAPASGEAATGVVMLAAAYDEANILSLPRRGALRGFVHAYLETAPFFRDLLAQVDLGDLRIKVRDAAVAGEAGMVYRAGSDADFANADFSGTWIVPVFDRAWEVHVASAPGFVSPVERATPWVLFLSIAIWGPLLFTRLRARHEVALERERLIQALARSNAELDQFAYVASHDLKAPLRAIANLSEWLEEDLGPVLTGETREQMSLLRGRVHRLEALIEGILAYSRAGRVASKVETVDVDALVREVEELLSPGPGAELVVEPGLPTLLTERVPLQQVFLNLLGNAFKHGASPDGRVHVTVSGSLDEGIWHFAVRDLGRGIASEQQERVWGLFTTLRPRDEIEGTGIGLAVVRKLVVARGGRTWLESIPGEGTTFHFTWPPPPKRD